MQVEFEYYKIESQDKRRFFIFGDLQKAMEEAAKYATENNTIMNITKEKTSKLTIRP